MMSKIIHIIMLLVLFILLGFSIFAYDYSLKWGLGEKEKAKYLHWQEMKENNDNNSRGQNNTSPDINSSR